jgi:hypothetical protein
LGWAGKAERLSPVKIQNLPWWKAYRDRLAPEEMAFDEILQQGLGPERAFCPVHGDLSTANVVLAGNTPWIYDWESATERGPLLTDQLGLFLSFTVGRAVSEPLRCGAILAREFLTLRHDPIEVMLALAYRHACGFPDTPVYLQNWNAIISSAR